MSCDPHVAFIFLKPVKCMSVSRPTHVTASHLESANSKTLTTGEYADGIFCGCRKQSQKILP